MHSRATNMLAVTDIRFRLSIKSIRCVRDWLMMDSGRRIFERAKRKWFTVSEKLVQTEQYIHIHCDNFFLFIPHITVPMQFGRLVDWYFSLLPQLCLTPQVCPVHHLEILFPHHFPGRFLKCEDQGITEIYNFRLQSWKDQECMACTLQWVLLHMYIPRSTYCIYVSAKSIAILNLFCIYSPTNLHYITMLGRGGKLDRDRMVNEIMQLTN